MTLARRCEACDKGILEGNYFDVMVTLKDVEETPEQTGQSAYGDFCGECLSNGNAVRDLVDRLQERNK